MAKILGNRGAAAAALGLACLSGSCAFGPQPQAFRNNFVPPAHHAAPTQTPVLDPPQPGATPMYGNEMPVLDTSIPSVPRPSDADFLIKKANDRYAEGKKAAEQNRTEDARREFDRAIEVLLSAPENLPDRSRVEKRLEELIEAIYRYDAQLAAPGDGDQVVYDKPPLDGMLEMTFPVDPNLRGKVLEQIQATVSQLPLQQDDSVVGLINFLSSERGKKIMAAGLKRQGKYKSMIERILAEEGVPQELIFVAQEESGFFPRALSNKKCVGLWQFGKETGAEYGLFQTPATDDRMDPEKATRAAARHLRDLYTHFGDWYLAIAAYDCGQGCVDHAVARTGYADFFELRRRNVFVKETANYVPIILAMTIIAKNAKDYGLDNLDAEAPLDVDSIQLQTPTHIALIADAVDRPLDELKELNPALLRLVAPAGFTIHVPKGTLPSIEQAFAVVPPAKRDSWRLHRVATGETFAGLSKRYSAPMTSISLANHEELPEAGSWVAIPVSYPGDRPVKTAAVAAKRPTAKRRTGTLVAAKTAAVAQPAIKQAAIKQAAAKQAAAKAAVSKAPTSKAVVSKQPARKAPVAQKSAAKSPVKRAAVAHTPNS